MKYNYDSYVKWYQSQEEKFPMASPMISREDYPNFVKSYVEATEKNQRSNLPRDIARSQRVITRPQAIKLLNQIKESEGGDSGIFNNLNDIMRYRGETWVYRHPDGTTETKIGTTKQALFMNVLNELGRAEANELYGY